jgi:hypothetical protein
MEINGNKAGLALCREVLTWHLAQSVYLVSEIKLQTPRIRN